jgi:hypothetical protein
MTNLIDSYLISSSSFFLISFLPSYIHRRMDLLCIQVNLCEPNPCGLNQKCIDHGTNISCECIPGLDLALCAEMNSVRFILYVVYISPTFFSPFPLEWWIGDSLVNLKSNTQQPKGGGGASFFFLKKRIFRQVGSIKRNDVSSRAVGYPAPINM